MESLPRAAKPEPRRATSADAGALARLAELTLPLGRTERDFGAEIARQDTGATAVWRISLTPPAEEGAAGESAGAAGRSTGAAGEPDIAAPLLGGAVLRLAADEAELLWLAVHPGYRRRGLARALLAAALDWADERSATVFLEVRASNEAAVALYTGAGFVVAGRRARYYRDGEDAVLLRRPASR